MINKILPLIIVVLLSAFAVFSQTTEFTYQGSLQNSSAPASGNFDFEFLLFDSVTGGTQIGTTLTKSSVAVSAGTFAVKLDFGGQFPGVPRFLEIRVRPTGGGAYTPLVPRQQVNSAPYSVKAVNADNAVNATNATNAATATNATQLGGVAASQYVLSGDARLSDARNPLPNSSSYVQNQNAGPQASSNFNISGTGRAGAFDALAQYNLSGNRVLWAQESIGNLFLGPHVGDSNTTGNSNTFVGWNAGNLNTVGDSNTFNGSSAGRNNTTGRWNAFFGVMAGLLNTSGGDNAFFGAGAGLANSTAIENSFFGASAGQSNTIGRSNAFIGSYSGTNNVDGAYNSFLGGDSGRANIYGSQNAFVGFRSGSNNTFGNRNTFVGMESGRENTNGSRNTFVGDGSGLLNGTGSGNSAFGIEASVGTNLSNATAVGGNASVTQNNSLILGSINGVNGATSDTNVGIGTTAPSQRMHVVGNGLFTGNLTVNGTINGAISLSSVTGVLGPGNGGTGFSSVPVAGTFLRSNGAAWTASGVLVSDVPSGSMNYIQNQNAAPQAGSNFNISGDGTAGGTISSNIVNASTQFNIAGQKVLSIAGSNNFFAGANSGTYNTGGQNLFVGSSAGPNNTTGSGNVFLGSTAGLTNTSGYNNSFVGSAAGNSNTTGIGNVALGSRSNFAAFNLNNATAIGFNSYVSQSNSMVLGSINGVNSATADTNVGIGTTAPAYRLHVVDPSNQGLRIQTNTAGGRVASFGGNGEFQVDGSGLAGGRLKILENGNVGIGMPFGSNVNNKLDVVGTVGVWTLSSGGSVPLCWHTVGYNLSTCGSSVRYKKNLSPFTNGLNLLRRFQPITFDWKEGGMHDLGLGAEDVAAIEPLLVTYTKDGQVDGVKYDRIGVVLINAVKEQQAQIEAQQKQIASLTKIVCAINSNADICRQ